MTILHRSRREAELYKLLEPLLSGHGITIEHLIVEDAPPASLDVIVRVTLDEHTAEKRERLARIAERLRRPIAMVAQLSGLVVQVEEVAKEAWQEGKEQSKRKDKHSG